MDNGKIKILYVLIALMFLNILVSSYLLLQSNASSSGESFLGDSCFAEGTGSGNCADVQSSEYSKMLGVSLPVWGILSFSFMFIILLTFTIGIKSRKIISTNSDLETTRKAIAFFFIIGALGAIYFIYLQLFVIGAICKYCMIVDSITIFSSITYLISFKKPINFNKQ